MSIVIILSIYISYRNYNKLKNQNHLDKKEENDVLDYLKDKTHISFSLLSDTEKEETVNRFTKFIKKFDEEQIKQDLRSMINNCDNQQFENIFNKIPYCIIYEHLNSPKDLIKYLCNCEQMVKNYPNFPEGSWLIHYSRKTKALKKNNQHFIPLVTKYQNNFLFHCPLLIEQSNEEAGVFNIYSENNYVPAHFYIDFSKHMFFFINNITDHTLEMIYKFDEEARSKQMKLKLYLNFFGKIFTYKIINFNKID